MGSKKYRNRPGSSKKATADSLQRLGEKYARKHGRGGGFVINQENKLSAAIIDIAQPLLDRAETPEDKKDVLHMALVAWMTAVLPEDHGGPNVLESMREVCGDDPEAIAVMEVGFEGMLERKRTLYPDDRRVPLDYEMEVIGDKLQFNVVGTVPNALPRKK